MFVVISAPHLSALRLGWRRGPGPAAEAGSSTSPTPRCRWTCSSRRSGQPVKLSDYFHPNRPVVLVMVYFGWHELCGPALNGVTEALRKVDLQPGRDFEIVTVSFKPEEELRWPA